MIREATRGVALLSTVLLLTGLSGRAAVDAERRVLDYIRNHLHPGEPLVVTELYSHVFTQPEERKVLDKLYNAFFRIPLFVAQHQEKLGAPPSLKVIAQQFDLKSPDAAEVLVRVMESDPRVPRFFTRNPVTGEIKHVDVEKIRADPRFGQALSRQLAGWEGKPAPDFTLPGLAGDGLSSQAPRDKLLLLYVWFTGCPPCMKMTPALVSLAREFSPRDFVVVGANADQTLGLSYDDGVRRRYAEAEKINFPVAHWTREADAAFGNIAIFPTLFLIDPKGVIIRHWVGFVSPEELQHAVSEALGTMQAD